MQKKSSVIKSITFVLLLAIVLVVIFAFLTNRGDDEKVTNSGFMTPVQEVLNRNLKTNYPGTPKEVLKLYSEITRCFYSEKYTEEELAELAKKSRDLFDDELRALQTDDEYLAALKKEIDDYKENSKTISSFSVSNSTDVKFYYYDGYDWAQLYCIYSVRVATSIQPVQERFLMRRDADDHWKIVGWKLAEEEDE